jgi:hypothetical protein
MEGAFVVQLAGRPDLGRGLFAGRIEHVDSGWVAHFETLREFLEFISNCLFHAGDGAGVPSGPGSPPIEAGCDE